MNAWKRWSWCFLLILQLTKADEIPPNEKLLTENTSSHTDGTTTRQERQRRDSEWPEDVPPYRKNEAALRDQSHEFTKRTPILSRWGGQRLSDLLYFKRRPAFSSWGGKRGPAFSSWGGKRSMPNNNFENPQDSEVNSTNTIVDLEGDSSSLPPGENTPDISSGSSIYKFIKNEILKNLETSDKQQHTALIYDNGMNTLRNFSKELHFLPTKMYSASPTENKLFTYYKNNDFLSNNSEDYDNEDEDFSKDNDSQEDFEYLGNLDSENKGVNSDEILNKRASPSFNSWGGKRALPLIWSSKWTPEFNHWQSSKKATAFNSWGGKRAPAFNSWGGKRAPAFNSWGGKRAPAFNSWGGKRAPAFNSWGGKRATAFNSWGGKRAPAFNSWGGKRAPAFNSWGGKRTPAFNSWGGKRSPAFNSWGGKRTPDFNLLTDEPEENSNWENTIISEPNSQRSKRSVNFPNMKDESSATNIWEEEEEDDHSNTNEKRTPAFNSWGGKRATAFNSWGGKRAPAFNSRGGKKATAFNSWGGKRMPAFNSWGGKRSPAFNSWGGKRAPAFNSWGGKRVPAFNSWGGKRAPAFNSWGGKRSPAFNSWGGKRSPAFNSWGGKRTPFEESDNNGKSEQHEQPWENEQEPVYYSTENKRYNDDKLDDKRATSFSKGGKRLPAFHSWGGKRFKSLTTLTPNENTIHFLGSGTDQNHPFEFNMNKDNTDIITTLLKDPDGTANNLMSDFEYVDTTDDNECNTHQTDEINSSIFTNTNLYNKNSNENTKNADDIVTHSIESVNEDNDHMKDPINFGWDNTRNNIMNTIYNDKTNEKNSNSMILKNQETFPNTYNENINLKVKKRNLDTKYNTEYLSHSGKSSYTDKRRPIFTSWGGKRSVLQFHNDNFNSDDNNLHVRKKRFIGSEAENAIALIMSDDITGTGSNLMDDMYSTIPTGTTICCIKRAQYGDRNLFMQMLLRTKSFRDLSWPTIRPIRRGADFYPWGGKRSSL